MRTTKTQSSFHPSDRKEAKPLAVRNLNTAHDFNVPVSQLKFRCEKENTLPTNFDPVSIEDLMREEELAMQRELEKKRKLEEFQRKVMENSKKILSKQKEQKQKMQETKEHIKQKRHNLMTHAKPLPVVRVVRGDQDETSTQPESVTPIERDTTLEDIASLARRVNIQNTKQKNELIRMRLCMHTKN